MVECQEKNTEICYVGDLKEFVGVTEITSWWMKSYIRIGRLS